MVVAQLGEFTKNRWRVPLKRVDFTVYKSFLDQVVF